MGNTEGTPEPGDSVETTRGASVSKEQLQQDYDAAGSLRKLADMYGIERHKLRDILANAGILIKSRRQAITNSWMQEERVRIQREKITATWKDTVIRESRLAHWEEPGERDQQRQAWLQRIEATRKRGRDYVPAAEINLREALVRASVSFTAPAVVLDGRYIVDALIRSSIVVEVDGVSHRIGNTALLDKIREQNLRDDGLTVIRFAYRQIADDPDACVASLQLAPEVYPMQIMRSHFEALTELNRIRREHDR